MQSHILVQQATPDVRGARTSCLLFLYYFFQYKAVHQAGSAKAIVSHDSDVK